MSNIIEDRSAFGERLRRERQARDWTLDQLAGESGVSRAMISRIERGESSPTAVVLGRLSAALRLSVSELLAEQPVREHRPAPPAGGTVRRAAELPQWRDPETGYLRRQVSTPGFPVAVTEVVLPPAATVPYPAAAYAFIAQLVWVLSGELSLADGDAVHVLAAGDTFELGEPRPREFRNETAAECRYAVVVTRKATA
jgi:transcriptional regulator with XRE-family HTH domain